MNLIFLTTSNNPTNYLYVDKHRNNEIWIKKNNSFKLKFPPRIKLNFFI